MNTNMKTRNETWFGMGRELFPETIDQKGISSEERRLLSELQGTAQEYAPLLGAAFASRLQDSSKACCGSTSTCQNLLEGWFLGLFHEDGYWFYNSYQGISNTIQVFPLVLSMMDTILKIGQEVICKSRHPEEAKSAFFKRLVYELVQFQTDAESAKRYLLELILLD